MNGGGSGAPAPHALFRRMIEQRDAGRLDDALATLREAVALYPDDAEAEHNLGMFLAALGRPEEGEPHARRALALAPHAPEIAYVLATCLLAQGKYREGLPLYEARLRMPAAHIPVPKGFPFPRWAGEDVTGKRIAIFPEQGNGDQIQFVRFVRPLVARGVDITLLVRPPLADLFAASFPEVRVVPAEGAVSFPDPDYWAMTLDLARMADATPETLPQPPYLKAPAVGALPAGFRVGLMTRGNPHFAQDARRSLSPGAAARLRRGLPGQIVDLDPEATGAKNFADTAAIIQGCDLVVAVDTAAAHLAGALDRPCFILIQGFGADWRWMARREDTPWYPRTRLFRAGLDREWMPVVDRVLAAARDMASTAAASPR